MSGKVNPYMQFAKVYRSEHAPEMKGWPQPEVAKATGAAWKKLTPAEKANYGGVASGETRRPEAKKRPVPAASKREASDEDVSDLDDSNDDADGDGRKRAAHKKKQSRGARKDEYDPDILGLSFVGDVDDGVEEEDAYGIFSSDDADSGDEDQETKGQDDDEDEDVVRKPTSKPQLKSKPASQLRSESYDGSITIDSVRPDNSRQSVRNSGAHSTDMMSVTSRATSHVADSRQHTKNHEHGDKHFKQERQYGTSVRSTALTTPSASTKYDHVHTTAELSVEDRAREKAAFTRFFENHSNLRRLIEIYPGLSRTELAEKAVKLWSSLSDEEKAPYQSRR
jgi:hypothetical protein